MRDLLRAVNGGPVGALDLASTLNGTLSSSTVHLMGLPKLLIIRDAGVAPPRDRNEPRAQLCPGKIERFAVDETRVAMPVESLELASFSVRARSSDDHPCERVTDAGRRRMLPSVARPILHNCKATLSVTFSKLPSSSSSSSSSSRSEIHPRQARREEWRPRVAHVSLTGLVAPFTIPGVSTARRRGSTIRRPSIRFLLSTSSCVSDLRERSFVRESAR